MAVSGGGGGGGGDGRAQLRDDEGSKVCVYNED